MIEPVFKALGVFDKHTPTMAKAWLKMNNLKKHVFTLQDPIFNFPAPMVAL